MSTFLNYSKRRFREVYATSMTRNILFACIGIVCIGLAGSWYWHVHTGREAPGVTLANPASMNCVKLGGTLEIRDEAAGQSGYCHLPSGIVCEEWALMRGECGTASYSPKLAIDLYPLYADAKWASTTAASVTIGTTTYSGASATSTAIAAGMNPGAVFTPFTKYYASLLAERGWHVANDLAAGGPMGGQDGYRNGSGVILVGYHVNFANHSADAPVSCPCTVSFSLFSNVGD